MGRAALLKLNLYYKYCFFAALFLIGVTSYIFHALLPPENAFSSFGSATSGSSVFAKIQTGEISLNVVPAIFILVMGRKENCFIILIIIIIQPTGATFS